MLIGWLERVFPLNLFHLFLNKSKAELQMTLFFFFSGILFIVDSQSLSSDLIKKNVRSFFILFCFDLVLFLYNFILFIYFAISRDARNRKCLLTTKREACLFHFLYLLPIFLLMEDLTTVVESVPFIKPRNSLSVT